MAITFNGVAVTGGGGGGFGVAVRWGFLWERGSTVPVSLFFFTLHA